MRKTTKAVSAILAVVMLIGVMMCAPFGVSAAETYGDFEYSLNDDNTCAITRYIGSASDLTIPSEIYGHKVSRIGASITNDFGDGVVGAFENCTSLTRVTIPDGVTYIGNRAFNGCTNLANITIPDSVTSIGYRAFDDCTSLTRITIPDSVAMISDSAFSGCTSLTNITIPDSVTSIGNFTFNGCTNLANITIPDSVTSIGYRAFDDCTSLTRITIPDSVAMISDSAFSGCTSLTNITIPDSVAMISDSAFSGCTSLTNITIPDSVTSIGNFTFRDCTSLASITIPDSVTWIGYKAFSGTKWEENRSEGLIYAGKIAYSYKGDMPENTEITLKSGTKGIVEYAFCGRKNLTNITFPDSVTWIGDSVFEGCTSLTSLAIPDGVTSIGKYAFRYCESLTSITIPDSVTSIGGSVFYKCTNLKSITIPSSVTSIGRLTFYNCTSLTSITIPDGVTSIEYEAFKNCTNLTSITIPDSVTNIGYEAFSGTIWEKNQPEGVIYAGKVAYSYKGNMPKNTEITLKTGTKSISYGAFEHCTNLTSISIPNGITSIGSGAFYNCTNLVSITISGSVTSIGDSAFEYCRSLKSITILGSVTSIGEDAFSGCKILTSVTIPNGVTSIGWGAFSGCKSLTSLTFLGSVTSIGTYAFSGCTNLTSITFPDSVTSIGEDAFSGCKSLTSVTIPNSVTSIGNYAFKNCTSLSSITIPDSVTSIAEQVFYGCKSLTSITIPSSVTSIREDAFENCTSLKSITVPSSVTSIGNRVFKDCTSLTSITIPDSVTYIGNEVFRGCTSLTNIKIPDSVTIIAEYAFYRCTNLTSITIPSSVTSIREDAFKNCTGLTIYGYENSYAQEYALNNDIPFVAIAGDYTFIKKHLEFIGDENANNTYHNQLKYFDVAKIALEDYGDLDNTYKLWKAVRGEIFENPYYTVLSDMVISESTAQGQLESFDIHLDSEFISVENDIIGLINSKVDLTPSQESKIKNMFKNRDFSDETTFKFCQDVLNNKVSKDELNSIFNAYDKTNTFLDVYNQGADIVESVYDTMNYSAILKAYENTSDEFKVVLMQMAYACQTENPWLYTAIEKYLNSDYDTEMRNKIVEEVAENGLNIGKALFKDSIESKVKTFLISNMDLSKVGTSVASGILAFVEGCKIGYAIGTGIDNLLFSTDDVSNSFVAASATAKTAGYLKYVLETNEANLRNDPTLKNTVLFCETYNMYKNIQLNIADTMIKYFSKNQSALINQVFKGNNISYENEIYNWQILKLNWQNSSCHKGYILNSSIKNITVACPVNIAVYNNAGEIVLEIADNAIKTDNGDVVATVCNNIKYVTLPDDSYNIKITATDDGTMSYSVCDLNVLENTSKTTCFENIKINKNSEYSGKVVSGSEYKQDDIALCNNNQKVSCKVSSYTNENKVAVSNIKLSSSSLSLLIGEQHTISAGVAPQNASNKSVTWYSENPEIAKVDEYGNVTAVSSGKTKIVCVSLEDNIKSECDVEVKCPFGDANGDGEITIEDATLIQKAIADIATLDADQTILADVNGDSEVSVFDVTLIQKYIVGGYSNTGNVGKPANV